MEHILPSRGIRQGDLLSLYLFILCMEALDHLTKEKCNEKSWTLVKSSNNGVAFSHLFRMIWCSLQKRTMLTIRRFRMCLVLFVLDPINPLVQANQGSTFPQMLMLILENPYVIS